MIVLFYVSFFLLQNIESAVEITFSEIRGLKKAVSFE